MKHLIDKDALVAEIKRLKNDAHNGVSYHQSRQNVGLNNELSTWEHLESAFATILKIINTLEVKEVDLEKEIKEEYLKRRCYGGKDNMLVILNEPQFNKIAKYFFELGLKTKQTII